MVNYADALRRSCFYFLLPRLHTFTYHISGTWASAPLHPMDEPPLAMTLILLIINIYLLHIYFSYISTYADIKM